MLVFPSRHRTIIRLSGRLPSSYSYTDPSDSETQYFVSFCTVSKYLNETIKNEKSLIRLDAIRLLYIYLAVKSLNETSNCFDHKHTNYFNTSKRFFIFPVKAPNISVAKYIETPLDCRA